MNANRSVTRRWLVTGWVGIMLALMITTAQAANIYYVATNGNHNSPFQSWNDAATNLHAVTNLIADGDLIVISNGVHAIESEQFLTNGVTLRGLNGPESTILRRTGSAEFRLFSLTHADAVLDGLTIENGYRPSGNLGGNVWMNAGLVTNCIIRNGGIYRGGGAGLYMNGGLVTHSAITNNVQTADQSGRYSIGGGGVLIDGGILQNSLIAYNTSNGGGDTAPLAGGGVRSRGGLVVNCLIRENTTTESRGYGGGVGVSGSGVILNCTIAANTASISAGGISSINRAGGVVTNCIVYGNTSIADDSPQDIDDPSIVAFSCSPDLTDGENDNITADPLYRDVSAGDFRLQHGSPAIDVGINQPWMLDATDLDGLRRILMGTVDMGCYETPPPRGSLFMFR